MGKFISLKNKYFLGVVVAVILIVVIFGANYFLSGGGNNNAPQGSSVAPTSTNKSSSPASTGKTTTKSTTKSVNTGSAGTQTYDQAVNQYANRRIQFNDFCQATPNSFSVRNGTDIMLDNRSAQSRTITVDGARYSLSGYGFRVVNLKSSSLPHTVVIDCGSGRNNANVILQ